MPLTGHLSDLSLSELIEFFCNQRKTGRLKVLYPKGSGHFYIQTGSVIDAKVGVLRGIDAVYYALTLPNASFEFSASTEKVERTINQPWTQVVLEGLRRLDEGITPAEAFPQSYKDADREPESKPDESQEVSPPTPSFAPTFLSFMAKDAFARRKPFVASAVAIAVLASIAAAGVPAGWYDKATIPVRVEAKTVPAPTVNESDEDASQSLPDEAQDPVVTPSDAAALAAKRQRERERAKRAAALNERVERSLRKGQVGTSDAAKQGPRKVTVTVTYDESGRVTQASGNDPTALRIARQKRFPAGQAGSATITIPIN